MKHFAMLCALTAFAFGSHARAAEQPKMPAPEKAHEWLKQLAGDWVTDAEAFMEPGKPPMKRSGSDSTRMLGGFWAVSELKSNPMGMSMLGQMTLGYDAKTKKYIGTWICNMDGTLWKYEGTLKDNVLTLETEGPNHMTGKPTKMKDVIELKGPDHKVLTSFMLGEDGKWVQFMTMNSKRKK